jgi:hypothetical protein
MRTIIAGSRTIQDYAGLEFAINNCGWKITEVVCGMARGVDTLGHDWAENNGVPCKEFPADWDTYGRRAGFVRNTAMAENADALILMWDGKSPGSKMMKDIALKKGLKFYELIV